MTNRLYLVYKKTVCSLNTRTKNWFVKEKQNFFVSYPLPIAALSEMLVLLPQPWSKQKKYQMQFSAREWGLRSKPQSGLEQALVRSEM